MLHTKHETIQGVPATVPPPPVRGKNAWIWIMIAVTAAAVLAVGAMWPGDDEPVATTQTPAATAATTIAPAVGPVTSVAATTVPPVTSPATSSPTGQATLTWAPAMTSPAGQVLAVTATGTGFLAAAHTTDGVAFWSSPDGDTWTVLDGVSSAFGPGDYVTELVDGPVGLVAHVSNSTAESGGSSSTVWTSTNGSVWHRSELVPDLPEVASPYVIQQSFVGTVLVGPDRFLAFGGGGLVPNLDLIATEFAPGYTADDVWAVDSEMRPDGGVLIVGFGDEEPIEIPFEALGVTAEDLGMILEGGPETGGVEFSMWSSADGVTWEPIVSSDLPDNVVPGLSASAISADDGFYLFAPGPDPENPEGPGVMSGFYSTDGQDWIRFALDGPPDAWMRSVFFGDGIFIAVGEDQTGQQLWTSPDARTWTRGSGDVFETGAENEILSFTEIEIGGGGYAVAGMIWVEPPEDFVMPEPVITKDGYAVTLGDNGVITVANSETGEILATIDPETGMSESIAVMEDETGVIFMDVVSGETLFTISYEEIDSAYQAIGEELGVGQPPTRVLRYSIDLTKWTLDTDEEMFGEGRFSLSGALGDEVAIAVVSTDRELWEMGENPLELPQTEIWVGTPSR